VSINFTQHELAIMLADEYLLIVRQTDTAICKVIGDALRGFFRLLF